ncbi:MAG TPA: hypothetical protein VH478_21280 [Trebonia sp.]|nr:hypothetical protein [Trebonia sp.]
MLLAAVAAVALLGVLAGRPAHAGTGTGVSPSVTPSSGIGLPAGLNKTGSGFLANAAYYQRALKSRLWTPSPGGLVYKACSYSVPEGGEVDGIRNEILFPDGSVEHVSRCAYPQLVKPRSASPGAKPAPTATPAVSPAAATTPPASTNGWQYDFADYSSPGPLARFDAVFATPASPISQDTDLANFMFDGIEDNVGDSIVQPIVGWGDIYTGKNGVETSNNSGLYLWMGSYYLWGGNAVAAAIKKVNAGDTINTSVVATKCNGSGGGCTWEVYMTDNNTGATSNIPVVSAPVYDTFYGGVYESYNAATCYMLFGNAHLTWRQEAVFYFSSPGVYKRYTPKFGAEADASTCGMYAVNYTSEIGGDILWTQ